MEGDNGVKHPLTKYDIDGITGRWTHSVTEWQRVHEKPEGVHGIAGRETFSHADDFLDGP